MSKVEKETNDLSHKETGKAGKEIFDFFLIFLFVVGVLGILFHYFFNQLPKIHETFTDIIIEHPAITGLNKSGELKLFWCLMFAGILFLALLFPLVGKISLRAFFSMPFSIKLKNLSNKYIPPCFIIIALPCLVRYVLYKTFSLPLLFSMLFLFLSYLLFQDVYKELLILVLFTYYGLMSIFTVVSYFSTKGNVSSNTLYLITLVFSLVYIGICLICKRRDWLPTGIRLLQFLLPFLLVVFLVDTYYYKEEFIKIPYAPFYYIFFVILFLLSQISVFYLWKKKNRLVSLATPVLIFLYNSFSAAPMYAQPDQHHHGEQMIPWQQVFELGQKLYTEYTPVSGLFPMVNGTIQNVLLNGTVSDYSPAISITVVLFSIITMVLLAKHVGAERALVFSVLFSLPSYNRQYMVLPVLLLLTLPSFVKKKGFWLAGYVFSCFLAGLYYPLFGAALLLGLMPFGIWQLITYIRSKEWKADFKKPGFYICWLLCITPIIFSIPLLFKMLKHTLTFSSQTILADGISLFGQMAPDKLFPYIADFSFKNTCYIFLRFFLPLIGVLLFVYILLKYILTFISDISGVSMKSNSKLSNRKLFPYFNPSLFFGLLAGGIALMVSYTYTLVRADYNMVLSRTAPILIAIMGIFLPVLLIAYGNSFSKGFSFLVIGIAFSLPMILYTKVEDMKFPNMWVYPNGNSDIVLDDGDKLFTYYTVPDGFYLASDLEISDALAERIGNGFFIADQVHYINDYESVIKKCQAVKEDVTYLGFDGQGFYYFNHVKACSTGYIPAAKSYEAQQSIIETAENNLPVIFLINSESNYYLYCWMWEKGYVYKASDQAFYPKELYELIYGNEPADNYLDYYTGEDYGHKLGLIPDSFGNSLDSLASLFEKDCSILSDLQKDSSQESYHINTDFLGTDYDFLYLEVSPASDITMEGNDSFQSGIITVSFDVSHIDEKTASNRVQSVTCAIKDGKLLIPMGMNPNWLLNQIASVTITAEYTIGDKTLPLEFQITEARLMQIGK